MKLGIMQPYFFPHMGYYSLIHHVDRWIFFDTVQYIRRGWINRNRILKPQEGWQYIQVPVRKHAREMPIKDVRVSDANDWRGRAFRQLEHYQKIAPYYEDVTEFLRDALENDLSSLAELNAHLIAKTFAYLALPFEYEMFSAMDLRLGEVAAPGDWALEISRELEASEYINPPGGREIFDKERFAAASIQLQFLTANPAEYSQRRREFIPGLSILDVMMFNSRDEIHGMLNDFELSQ